jgi:alpha-L-fucosidase 2
MVKNRINKCSMVLIACLTTACQPGDSREVSGEKFTPSQSLWYRQPAAKWSEALPVGNGRLGAMVFGGVGAERLSLNEESIWSRQSVETDRPGAHQFLPEIRELLFAGRHADAQKLIDREVLGPRPLGSYQPLGDLTLEFPGLAAQDYVRWLDLGKGMAGVRFQSDRGTMYREVFASPVQDVLVVRLAGEKRSSIDVSLTLSREEGAKTEVVDASTLRMSGVTDSGKATQGVRFVAGLQVVAEGGSVSAENGQLHVRGADSVTILLTAATDYAGGEAPETRVSRLLDAAVKIPYGQLKETHVAAHNELMQRVSLNLGENANLDPLPTDERLQLVRAGGDDAGLLALYFQYGRYLLVSSSCDPGTLPANLQGIWNHRLNPPWFSGWHFDINVQMNYWPVETVNLSELHPKLIGLLDRLRENGRKTAREVYDADGFVVSHRANADLFTSPVKGLNVWPTGAAWTCQHVWEHYAFNGDKEWLRATGYPILREASEFFLDWLVPNPVTGELVSGPSISPENTYFAADGSTATLDMGPTMDQQIIAELFDNTLAAAGDLGIEDEFVASVRAARAKLAPTRIASDGRIMEWSQEFREREPNHRHASHLYALYPGGAITPQGTPELAEAARKSLVVRTDMSTLNSLPDEEGQPVEVRHTNLSNTSNTGWSLAQFAGLWARLGDGEQARATLLKLLRNATYPNLMDTHPTKDGEGVFQIDGNLGATAAMAEMLLQSHAGEIDLLPALPLAWATGSVKGLRARGGLTVDIAWQHGRLAEAELRAAKADAVRIRVPGRAGVFRHEESLGVATASEPLDVATHVGDVLKIRPL